MELRARNANAALFSRARIADLCSQGKTGTQIGRELNLSQQRISQMKNRFINEANDLLCDDIPVEQAAGQLRCSVAVIKWAWSLIIEKQGGE